MVIKVIYKYEKNNEICLKLFSDTIGLLASKVSVFYRSDEFGGSFCYSSILSGSDNRRTSGK